tara:strand:- start:653 stop:1387 length:735 start_codon:yes stop_codon:yes gene_type:complete
MEDLGGTGTGQMDWYAGEHAFGTEADTPAWTDSMGVQHGQETYQGYGLQDLWNLHGGIINLFHQQHPGISYQGFEYDPDPALGNYWEQIVDYYESGGGLSGSDAPDWLPQYIPELYDPSESGESETRELYHLGYKEHQAKQKNLRTTTRGELRKARNITGHAGFAGGGRASEGILGRLKQMNLSSQGLTADWRAQAAGYTQDIIGSRMSYVDSLWDTYNTYTAGLGDDHVQPDIDWDAWEQQYG